MTFTGDVGRPVDSVMLPPAPPLPADYVVTESTYGNRRHPAVDPSDELADIVNAALWPCRPNGVPEPLHAGRPGKIRRSVIACKLKNDAPSSQRVRDAVRRARR